MDDRDRDFGGWGRGGGSGVVVLMLVMWLWLWWCCTQGGNVESRKAPVHQAVEMGQLGC